MFGQTLATGVAIQSIATFGLFSRKAVERTKSDDIRAVKQRIDISSTLFVKKVSFGQESRYW